MAKPVLVSELLVLFIVWLCCEFHYVSSLTIKEPTLRPVCPSPPALCQTSDSDFARNEHFYIVEGQDLIIQFQDGKHFQLQCPENITLENESLPRFGQLVKVDKVIVTKCPPPKTSYAEALAALNVHVLEWLHMEDGLFGSDTPLEARHVATLPATVWKLTISGRVSRFENAPLSENFTFKSSITDLRLSHVGIPIPVLSNLPPNLQTLHFLDTGLETLPISALERLTSLERIYLQEYTLTLVPELSVAPNLSEVFILAPLQQLPSMARFENVSLWNVQTLGSHVFGDCSKLKKLSVGYADSLDTLPANWLSSCSQLKSLEVIGLNNLKSLPPRLLSDATALESMEVRYCSQLTDLPAELFANTTRLSRLIMSYNRLERLPSGIFSQLDALRELDLSSNQLRGASGVLAALEALPGLRKLSLGENPTLGDLCTVGAGHIAVNGVSAVAHMSALQVLDLRRTGATQLCRDWADACSLLDVRLQYNNITKLEFEQLQFRCTTKVDLRQNPIAVVQYTQDNYQTLLKSPASFKKEPNVTIDVDSVLACDCRSYWFARALHENLVHMSFTDFRCPDQRAASVLSEEERAEEGEEEEPGGSVPFEDVSPEDMTCEVEASFCASNCSCAVKPRLGTSGVTRARCAGAGLARLPRLPSGAPVLAELLAPDNNITTLDAADIPDTMLYMDLSNNSISVVSAEATVALFSRQLPRPRTLLLAGNPLDCSCDNRPFVVAMQAYQNQVLDYAKVRCKDSRFVHEVEGSSLCAGRAGLRAAGGVAGAALLVAVLAGLALRLRPRLAARVKAALLRRGLCVRWALRPPAHMHDDHDDDKKFDVFVSYAHGDHPFVVQCLVPRLESLRYRVCVHFRDFTPGELITSQIENSIRNSRRTVVVLTENFANSTWGKAEFKLAHAFSVKDSRPRLVVIVLGDKKPEDMALDQDWKDYIKTNTYLSCDDSWFWARLKIALGKPRMNSNSTSSTEPML